MVGKNTVKVGEKLEQELENTKYQVFYDHADKSHEIVSHFNQRKSHLRGTSLAEIDIMIINSEDDSIVYLIEIEEKEERPKILIGDALSIVFGDYIRHKPNEDKRYLLNKKTKLLICSLMKEGGYKDEQVKFIEEKINILKKASGSDNAILEYIEFPLFNDVHELKERVVEMIIMDLKE